MTFSWFAHDLLMTCICLVHNLLMICSWLAYEICNTFLWPSQDLLMTFSWFSHDFLMTGSRQAHDFLMDFPWFLMSFSGIVHDSLTDLLTDKQTGWLTATVLKVWNCLDSLKLSWQSATVLTHSLWQFSPCSCDFEPLKEKQIKNVNKIFLYFFIP